MFQNFLEITFVITILMFALCGYSFAQCLKKKVQKGRCVDMKNELVKALGQIKDLRGCLEDEVRIFKVII